jgi:hypothetical protein
MEKYTVISENTCALIFRHTDVNYQQNGITHESQHGLWTVTSYRIAAPTTERHEARTPVCFKATANDRDGGLLGGWVGGTAGEGAFMSPFSFLCIIARTMSRSPSRQCPASALMK